MGLQFVKQSNDKVATKEGQALKDSLHLDERLSETKPKGAMIKAF